MKDERDLRPRTKMFARRIIRLYCALPKTDGAAQVLGKQALRAGTSIGANYREAQRARSKLEFISKIGDCLKEADETLYWLELLVEENFIPARRLDPLINEVDELLAILTTISKRSRAIT
jgi:four helix bundle protein